MKKFDEDFVRCLAEQPNMSNREIARRCNVDVKTIVRYMKNMGIKLTSPCFLSKIRSANIKPVKQVDIETLKDCVKNRHMTLMQLSKELNVHHLSLKKQLKDCGLSILEEDELIAIQSLLELDK